jgi:hypothetical protein
MEELTEILPTRLVQRLMLPRTPSSSPATPFSFGRGLRTGGLGPEALKALTGVCVFDYMGAAEFEYGEVPKALSAMIDIRNEGHLMLTEFRLGDFKPRKAKGSSQPQQHWSWDTAFLDTVVYVIGDIRKIREWQQRICELAMLDVTITTSAWSSSPDPTVRYLKEPTGMQRSMQGLLYATFKATNDPVGWLELDNAFLFTIDLEMALKFADMFTIEPSNALVKPEPQSK